MFRAGVDTSNPEKGKSCYVSIFKDEHMPNPRFLTINAYRDGRLVLTTMHWRFMTTNETNRLKEAVFKIDDNSPITVADHSQAEHGFEAENQFKLIEQLGRGSNAVVKTVYYSGQVKEFRIPLGDFTGAQKEADDLCANT